MMMKKYTKYKNKKVTYKNIKFDSLAEYRHYLLLENQEKTGEIFNLKLKPRFQIIPSFKDNQGNLIKGAFFTPEFQYEQDNKNFVIEIKSVITAKEPAYILRKKLFKLQNPNTIFQEIIKK